MQPLQADDPSQISDYTLLGRLGAGAMGVVYLGRSLSGRHVAVKVVRAELLGNPDFRERFRREVEMARSVGGFWTAAVVAADPAAGRPWLATEYVPGPTLHEAVKRHGPLPEPAVRRLAAGLAEALRAIHVAGLVHRDLKPSNVLLGADGPRVIDFGIARALQDPSMTATGAFFGTPGFLSPEQLSGDEVGPPCDVFALGAVLVYAATGHGPHGEGTTPALLYRLTHEEPDLSGVSGSLRDVIAGCLRRDPASRPTPTRVLTAMSDAASPAPTSAEWLPPAVHTLVEQYRTGMPRATAVETAVATSVATRAATRAADHPPSIAPSAASPAAATPPAATPPAAPSVVAGSPEPTSKTTPERARFGTTRLAAAVWGSASLLVALVLSEASSEAPGRAVPGRLLAFLGFVVLLFAAARLLISALRPQLTFDVSHRGLLLVRGRHRIELPWTSLARVRIVEHRKKPWLVVWLADGTPVPKPLGGNIFRPYHGGYRMFPVAHEWPRWRRRRETRELRAALGWYGRGVYDASS